MSNPVGWFEIYVDEMPRAKAFYETILGVTLETLSDPTEGHAQMWIFPSDMENYGSSGALVKMDGFSAGGNSTLVYFNCENCATEESRVAAAGGEIVRTKMSLGEYGFCTLVTDTEGNMFGLHSQQ
ncbi:VOC family protein [uncultured Paraglaciecola sp.]|uniref:VOC family protein n=1 Tax=uncultured Paraglaciecola sp. TaxID=1765024 RepID=UPI0030DB007C|tara:strand:+ start:233 stop:610 length:378 start_codon:yes stop_codon:yes gene_type:complete